MDGVSAGALVRPPKAALRREPHMEARGFIHVSFTEMVDGDNPPCGILLCTKKGPQMVEYALSGMDNQLFVSTYMLQLPNKEQLRKFLEEQMTEIDK